MDKPATTLTGVGGFQLHNGPADRANCTAVEVLQDAMDAKDTLLCCAFFAGLSSNFLRRFHIGQLQGTAQVAIMPVACSSYPLAFRQQWRRAGGCCSNPTPQGPSHQSH